MQQFRTRGGHAAGTVVNRATIGAARLALAVAKAGKPWPADTAAATGKPSAWAYMDGTNAGRAAAGWAVRLVAAFRL
jgi:hypothetical protein